MYINNHALQDQFQKTMFAIGISLRILIDGEARRNLRKLIGVASEDAYDLNRLRLDRLI